MKILLLVARGQSFFPIATELVSHKKRHVDYKKRYHSSREMSFLPSLLMILRFLIFRFFVGCGMKN